MLSPEGWPGGISRQFANGCPAELGTKTARVLTQLWSSNGHFALPNFGHPFILVKRPARPFRIWLLNGEAWWQAVGLSLSRVCLGAIFHLCLAASLISIQ